MPANHCLVHFCRLLPCGTTSQSITVYSQVPRSPPPLYRKGNTQVPLSLWRMPFLKSTRHAAIQTCRNPKFTLELNVGVIGNPVGIVREYPSWIPGHTEHSSITNYCDERSMSISPLRCPTHVDWFT